MAIGHRHAEKRTEAELYQMLGDADTPRLYDKSRQIATNYDIPYAGGISVDGRTIYIDRTLYRAVMDGEVKVRGMTAKQIIAAWCEHEATEWAIDSGDNPVDTYGGAHGYATAKEEKLVRMLGANPERYEEAISPALKQCKRRFLRMSKPEPPADLWCGPISEEADAGDKEILRIMRAKGVTDASKEPKTEVHYGFGEVKCRECAMYQQRAKDLSPCDLISGMVRWNRQCDRWQERK